MTQANPSFAYLLQSFFTQRLLKQKQSSPHTVGSYRDTFRLLLQFTQKRLQKAPSRLELTDVDARLVAAFLDDLEQERQISARSRNLRLTAIRSFFRYVAFEVPAQSEHIQRVLAIPSKRYSKALVTFLCPEEVESLLKAPIQQTWFGRRDHLIILLTVQTGVRLSELTGLKREDVVFGPGTHIRIIGKGRKERSIPLTKRTAAAVKAWLQEPIDSQFLFPNARGGRLSADSVQALLKKHVATANERCPSLAQKHVTFHCLRHTMAMEMLEAGIDRAMIALWLGHDSVETTQIYLHANLASKEAILSKIALPEGKQGRYRPDDQLLNFLKSL